MASSDEEPKPTFCQKLGNGCANFGNFLYDRESKTVMGRTGQSWAKIGVFYLFFYGFLAAFFIAMLAVFMTTIERPEDGGKPKLTQFIENQPGLTRLDQNLKDFKKGDKENKYLEGYDANQTSSKYAENLIKIFKGIQSNNYYKEECVLSKDNVTKPCYAPFSLYGDCKPDPIDIDKSMFGLKDKKPCVFIKINKVYGWVPAGNDYLELKCEGSGFIQSFPKGFLLNGFPFQGEASHHLPFVAVQVDASKSVKVECKLKGDGIKVSDSFNPARSYGNILIDQISAK